MRWTNLKVACVRARRFRSPVGNRPSHPMESAARAHKATASRGTSRLARVTAASASRRPGDQRHATTSGERAAKAQAASLTTSRGRRARRDRASSPPVGFAALLGTDRATEVGRGFPHAPPTRDRLSCAEDLCPRWQMECSRGIPSSPTASVKVVGYTKIVKLIFLIFLS